MSLLLLPDALMKLLPVDRERDAPPGPATELERSQEEKVSLISHVMEMEGGGSIVKELPIEDNERDLTRLEDLSTRRFKSTVLLLSSSSSVFSSSSSSVLSSPLSGPMARDRPRFRNPSSSASSAG